MTDDRKVDSSQSENGKRTTENLLMTDSGTW